MPDATASAPKTTTATATTPADTKWAVWSLVCGITGLVIPYIGLVLAILAIVFYFKQRKIQPNGMATAGLIIGIITIVLYIILLVFIVGLLAFIGAMEPSSFLPNKCTMSLPFSCSEYTLRDNALEITLRNDAGADMQGVTVTATGCGDSVTIGTIANAGTGKASFTCDVPTDSAFKSTLTARYTIGTGVERTAAGTVYLSQQ